MKWRIQNPVKDLQWCFLAKTAVSYFCKEAPSHIFDEVITHSSAYRKNTVIYLLKKILLKNLGFVVIIFLLTPFTEHANVTQDK